MVFSFSGVNSKMLVFVIGCKNIHKQIKIGTKIETRKTLTHEIVLRT